MDLQPNKQKDQHAGARQAGSVCQQVFSRLCSLKWIGFQSELLHNMALYLGAGNLSELRTVLRVFTVPFDQTVLHK